MKTIISALAVAGLFSMTACNRTELKEKEVQLAAKQHTIDSMNIALAKQQAIDSMNEMAKYQYTIAQPLTTTPVVQTVSTTPRRTAARRSTTRRYAANTQPVYTQPAVYQEQPVKQKRGWSAKAKGAVIGAGTGAAAGAIINGRNRVAGAVIGGLLGAGAGTGIGAIIDHKNGR